MLTWRPKYILAVVGSLILVLSFQNCSGRGFKTVAGIGQSSTALKAPLQDIELSITSAIPALINTRTLSVNILAKYDPKLSLKSLTCQLNSQSAVDCKSLVLPLTALADSDYVLKINAEDSAGQKAKEVVATFRVDATAPTQSFTSTPAAVSGSTSAQFSFSAADNLSGVSSIECSLDTSSWSACTSPKSYSGLGVGSHTFKIRAKDQANNWSSETPYTWTINTAAPAISISTKPNSFVNTAAASFSFSGTHNGQAITEFECQLDSSGFTACGSPKAYASVAAGAHTFYVRGKDSLGVMSSPVTASWTVDMTAPTTPIVASSLTGATVSGTYYTKMTSGSANFSSTDASSGVASYSCSVDGGAFAACTSPHSFASLAAGAHTISVRATDNAMNNSAVGSYSFNVDLTNPTKPANLAAAVASSSQINLSWTAATDNSAVTNYKVYRGGTLLTTLGNVLSYQNTGLSAATAYSYTVESVDAVGNVSGQTTSVSATTQAASGGGGGMAGLQLFDDFEDGTTNKWEQDGDGRNRCTVVTTSRDGIAGPYAGTRMLRCDDNGTVAYDAPNAFETLGFGIEYTNEFLIRTRFRIDSNHDRDAGSGKKIMRIFYWTGDNSTYNDIFATLRTGPGVSNEGVAGGSQFATYYGGASGDTTSSSSSWHEMEYYINKSGVVKVWHDGVLVQNHSNLPTNRGSWAPFYITSNYSGTHDALNTIYFDNFEIFNDKTSGATGSMSDGSVQRAPAAADVARVFFDGGEASGGTWTQDSYRDKCRDVTTSSTGNAAPRTGTHMVACNTDGTVVWNTPKSMETMFINVDYNSEIFFRSWVRRDAQHYSESPKGSPRKLHRWDSVSFGVSDFFVQAFTWGAIGSYCQAGGPQCNPVTYWGEGNTGYSATAWHKLEEYFKQESSTGAGNGIFRQWVDGVQVVNITNLNYTANGKLKEFHITSNWSDCQDNAACGTNNNVYFDDIEVFSDKGTGTATTGSMANATIKVP